MDNFNYNQNQITYSNNMRGYSNNEIDYTQSIAKNQDNILKEMVSGINRTYTEKKYNANKLDEALIMIKNSIQDELSDELFYSQLINQAISEEEKMIISEIRTDEKKHVNLLKKLYYDLTKMNPPESSNVREVTPKTYRDNLKEALLGECKAAEKYRKIMQTMPDKQSYDVIMEIMVDELRHIGKYNFLLFETIINPVNKGQA